MNATQEIMLYVYLVGMVVAAIAVRVYNSRCKPESNTGPIGMFMVLFWPLAVLISALFGAMRLLCFAIKATPPGESDEVMW